MRKKPATPPAFEARVRGRLPHARRLLTDGGLDPTKCAEIEEFVDVAEPGDLTDDQLTAVSRYADSFYVLGLAVGLLLGPAFFTDGGR